MTLENFKADYKFVFNTEPEGRTLTITTEVIRRADEIRIAGVESKFDIFETEDQLRDSQTETSIIKWDWDKLIEETKRAQLDHFAKHVPIEDFFPRNRDTEIESLYI